MIDEVFMGETTQGIEGSSHSPPDAPPESWLGALCLDENIPIFKAPGSTQKPK